MSENSSIDMTDMMRKSLSEYLFDRWLAEHDRVVKSKAWAEGFAEGLGDGCNCDGCLKWVSNPYREETE